MSDLKKKAREVAEAGRFSDSYLLHVSGDELASLLDSVPLTRNPKTGVYEAFSLSHFIDPIKNIVSNVAKPVENIASTVADVGKSAFNKVLNPRSSENIFKSGPLSVLFPTQNPDVQKAAGLAGGALLGAEGLGLSVPGVATAASPGATGATALIDPQSGPLGAAVGATDPLAAAVDAATGASDITDTGAIDPLLNAVDQASAASDITGTTAATPSGGASKGAGVLDFLAKNKGLLVPAVTLGAQVLSKPKIPQVPNLENIASTLEGGPVTMAEQNAATSLIPSLSTGQLPPGAESMVSNATNDAVGSIKAKYAQLGMSGSTAETQEIAAAQARGEAMRFQFATQATQTGLQAAGLVSANDTTAAQIYQIIMNAQLQSDQALQNALSNFSFASALGSGLVKG